MYSVPDCEFVVFGAGNNLVPFTSRKYFRVTETIRRIANFAVILDQTSRRQPRRDIPV